MINTFAKNLILFVTTNLISLFKMIQKRFDFFSIHNKKIPRNHNSYLLSLFFINS